MGSDLYWFVISPISSVVTAAIAFAFADGIWRLPLLGIAVVEALPLLLLLLGYALTSVVADDVH
jgi:hypothetical protein